MAGPLDILDDGEPGPLYWVAGKERFLVDRAVAMLKERTLDPRTRDFNYDSVWAKEAGAAKIASLARTLPMMAKRRLVLVRDADALDAKELEQLVPYVAAPCAETCLVLVGEKADQRLKFFTAFKKTGVLVKLDPLPERQLPAFVVGEAKRRGLRCDAGAAEMLVAEVGADLSLLADAVERIELYLGGRKEIRHDDVEAVVTTTRTRSVFELSDAIGEGDVGRALAALGSLAKAREPGLKILAMIGRQIRLLLTARQILDEKGPRRSLPEALGVPPFVADKIAEQARRFTQDGLVDAHRAIYETDQRLKNTRLDDDRWLERLVLQLARR